MVIFLPFPAVVFQEVPGELSLGFMVAGCKIGCPGCSYRSLHEKVELTAEKYEGILHRYAGLASCVLFLGGEWSPELPSFLDTARRMGYRTCLYTGREKEEVPETILSRLDFLKTGRWLGVPLGREGTNQRFWKFFL